MIRERRFVESILEEDIGRGDLFALCVTPTPATAHIIAKEDGVLAGLVYAKELEEIADITIEFKHQYSASIQKGDLIAVVSGTQTRLLSIERTLLNMMQHASGIATNARAYSALLDGSGIKILDTRKTRPLLREFEKYAARMGGVVNHRLGLDDCLMLKDTHLKTIKEIPAFIAHARTKIPFTSKIEMECETLDQVKIALESGVDIIMCDNMDIKTIKAASMLRDEISPSVLLEASGNITTQTVKSYIGSGIDALSSGSIVHQATWLDFSMKMQ
jgi:nicotinate-nucleotide pyrophosphorylase (carboxylating)